MSHETNSLNTYPAPPHTLRQLGRVGFADNPPINELEANYPALPEGYSYQTSERLDNESIAALLHRTGAYGTVTQEDVEAIDLVCQKLDYQQYSVGVRSPDGALVGIGQIIRNGSQGELGNFAVDPEHQRLGLGKAIIQSRLTLAEQLGIDSLYVTNPLPTNTLRDYYLELGFAQIPGGHLVRGPNPAQVY